MKWNICLCLGSTCKGCLSRTNCQNEILRSIISISPGAILQPLQSEYYRTDTIRVSCREGYKLSAGSATSYSCESRNPPDNSELFLAKNALQHSLCVRKFLHWFPFVGLLSACNSPKSRNGVESFVHCTMKLDGPIKLIFALALSEFSSHMMQFQGMPGG